MPSFKARLAYVEVNVLCRIFNLPVGVLHIVQVIASTSALGNCLADESSE